VRKESVSWKAPVKLKGSIAFRHERRVGQVDSRSTAVTEQRGEGGGRSQKRMMEKKAKARKKEEGKALEGIRLVGKKFKNSGEGRPDKSKGDQQE